MNQNTESTDYRQIRLNKLDQLKKLGINPYPSSFNVTNKSDDLIAKYAYLEMGEKTEDIVSIAGRVMSNRNNGLFIDLQDENNKIQIAIGPLSMTPAGLTVPTSAFGKKF